MSSNLLKRNITNLKQDEKKVIAVNELMAKRIEALGLQVRRVEREGFVSGLSADRLADEILSEDDNEGLAIGNVIKAGFDDDGVNAGAVSDAQKEAEAILARAQAQAEEIEQMARVQAEQEKEKVRQQARQEGYAEGLERAQKENSRLETQYREKEKQLEAEYQRLVDELEPQFVDTITGIYEHLFHVELHSYREVLCHLISTTLRKTEGGRDFVVHVSKEDYPYVSMQKKQIVAGVTAANSNVEIVEDITLSKNECMIETEGGVFDCGLGTQLSELRQKLKLLSYER